MTRPSRCGRAVAEPRPFWKDDIRRAKMLKGRAIHYIDVGTSGGVWGLDRGYCMMIGGPKAIVDRLDPIFKALAPGLGNVGSRRSTMAFGPPIIMQ